MKINMHIHSNKSLDGKEDINQILEKCQKEGIEIVSITDHDTCEAYKDITINFPNKIVNGIEADALIGNKTYDFLCYDFNLEEIGKWASNQYGNIQSRQTKIYKSLLEICKQNNIIIDDKIPYNPDTEYAHNAIYRMIEPQNKDYLEKLNITSAGDFYRETTINENCPLYIDMHIVWPDIKDLVKIIHQNGGKVFLAHPFKYSKDEDVETLLENAKQYIDGIEVYNETTETQTEYLINYAKENNLLMSAGSDYHATEKHKNLTTPENDYLTNHIIKWLK